MIEALQMLKYLKRKEWLDWMKDWQVKEGELVAEVQSEALAVLVGATEMDRQDLLLHLLGDADSYKEEDEMSAE